MGFDHDSIIIMFRVEAVEWSGPSTSYKVFWGQMENNSDFEGFPQVEGCTKLKVAGNFFLGQCGFKNK